MSSISIMLFITHKSDLTVYLRQFIIRVDKSLLSFENQGRLYLEFIPKDGAISTFLGGRVV